jgi:hypothetical protein
MTPLEEFKEKVKAGEMFDALAIAMSESIELNITTSVASSKKEGIDETQPGYRMRTRINLVDGEVDNEIGREFITNPAYAELQKLHLEQVKQGREILLNNLASLQSMFAMLNDTQSSVTEISPKQEDNLLPEG